MNTRYQRGIAALLKALCLSLLVALLSACGGGGGITTGTSTPPATLSSIAVTPTNPGIAPGTTIQLTATGTYSNITKQNLSSSATWSSSDTGIATVNNRGMVTAASTTGSAVITAVSGTITGSTTLTASLVTAIAVSPSTSSIAPGTTQQFAASGTLANSAEQNLTPFTIWSSSTPSVATIGESGLATAGTTTGATTIGAEFSGITGSAALTTSGVASIMVSLPTASIAKGTTNQFTAAGQLQDTASQDLTSWATWSSSNAGVATISNASGSKGLAASVGIGLTAITAMFSNITGTATLAVTPAVLTSLTVTPANPSIVLGANEQFIAIGTFSDSTTQDLSSSATWTSSNTGVATISNTSGSKGLATSLTAGTTTITAGLSGITSNVATLVVTPARLASIAVTPASATISVSITNTQQFTAKGIFSDGSSQDLTTSVTWASSNLNVPINSKGLAADTTFLPGLTTSITATFSGITSNTAMLTFTF